MTSADQYNIYQPIHGDGPGPAVMGANTLIGDHIHNAQDEHLGQLKEIMLDTKSGEIAYAVLSRGGVFTLGEKLYAVPWSALHLNTEKKNLVLNVDKERFDTAPGFDPNNWPDMADLAWRNNLDTYYGVNQSR
ncbi:PRC-barrel domain-containing protein [Undibacterium sp. TJN19]|uniref:PRC-barrel domain-containing protein n=1 Tax=Undibacterium sp. TJN19 TaxID=3413055 RepID=UPI003BF15A36